jgi:hypothetical protein
MPTIRIDLDPQTFRKLTETAVDERRPVAWQAVVWLQRALGLPAPAPLPGQQTAWNKEAGCVSEE